MQSYHELATIVAEINREIVSAGKSVSGVQIQKIYSTPHYLALGLRFTGYTKYFYLGRGGEYSGILAGGGVPPESRFRIKDRFLDYVRKYLRGNMIQKIELDKMDRIISIKYGGREREGDFLLFWRGRSCYFANKMQSKGGKEQLFISWAKNSDDLLAKLSCSKNCYAIFDSLGRYQEDGKVGSKEHSEQPNSHLQLNSYFQQLEKMLAVDHNRRQLRRKEEYYRRKIKRIDADLNKVKRWRDLEKLVQNPEMIFPDGVQTEGFEKLELAQVKIKFPKNINHYQKRDWVYQVIKRYRQVEQNLAQRLKDVIEDFEQWKAGGGKAEDDTRLKKLIVCPYWQDGKVGKLSSSKVGSKSLDANFNYELFRLPAGGTLAIGKDAVSNDYLRCNWAAKEDYWFHLEGEKSGHLFAKGVATDKLLSDYIGIIGAILLEYSKLNREEAHLIYTEVRSLRGVKGAKGAVLPRKARYIKAIPAANWREILAIR